MTNIMYKIAEATRAAAAFQREGLPIEAAVVKAAQQHRLNLEMTRRVAESLNTLNTLEHFGAGEKTAEFPVADGRAVVAQLFAKEAHARQGFPEVPAEYLVEASTRPPLTFREQILLKQAHALLEGQTHEKVAQQQSQQHRDPRMLAQMVEAEIRSLEKEAADFNVSQEQAKFGFLQQMQRIAESFQYQGQPSFNQFAKEAATVYSGRVGDHLRVLSKMIPPQFHGPAEELTKQSAYYDDQTTQHRSIQEVFRLEDQYAHFAKQASQLLDKARSLKEGLRAAFFSPQDIAKSAQQNPTPTVDPVYELARGRYEDQLSAFPIGGALPSGRAMKSLIGARQQMLSLAPASESQLALQARQQALDLASLKKRERDAGLSATLGDRFQKGVDTTKELTENIQKTVTPVGAAVRQIAGGALGGISAIPAMIQPEGAYGYFDQLEQSIRMQSSIQQTLEQDPILKERSSEELLPIIQTLVQVAPEVVSYPPVLASILRQATSGQYETLDPLTLQQLAETQTQLWKNREIHKRRVLGQRGPELKA